MTLRTGKSGRYRYYTCCTKARQGETGCPGRTVPMEKLDNLVAEYIEQRLLLPERLERLLSHVLDRRTERAERRRSHIAELRKRAAEADAKLKRPYDGYREWHCRSIRSQVEGPCRRAESNTRPGPP